MNIQLLPTGPAYTCLKQITTSEWIEEPSSWNIPWLTLLTWLEIYTISIAPQGLANKSWRNILKGLLLIIATT